MAASVIAADLPGLGDSDDVREPHTPEKLADIVAQGLDQILSPNQSFHLVGFSFGGLLGSLVAATCAERCLTFTAVGASGFGDLHAVVEGIERPRDGMTAIEIDHIHRKNLGLLMFADPAAIDPLSLYIHETNVARGRIKSRRMSVSDALVQTIPHIKARLGGIWGAFDATAGGYDSLQKRRHLFRSHQVESRFHIIADAGHWVMYEKADAFNKTLLQHLCLTGD